MDLASFFGDHYALVAVIVLLSCFIYVLSLLFSGPKPGKNPFSTGHVKPAPERVVTDQKARNNVLKQSKYDIRMYSSSCFIFDRGMKRGS